MKAASPSALTSPTTHCSSYASTVEKKMAQQIQEFASQSESRLRMASSALNAAHNAAHRPITKITESSVDVEDMSIVGTSSGGVSTSTWGASTSTGGVSSGGVSDRTGGVSDRTGGVSTGMSELSRDTMSEVESAEESEKTTQTTTSDAESDKQMAATDSGGDGTQEDSKG
jgi:hypothetical protein